MRTSSSRHSSIVLRLALGVFAGLALAIPGHAVTAEPGGLDALCDTHPDLSPLVISESGAIIPDATTALCKDLDDGLGPLAASAAGASSAAALAAFSPVETVATDFHSHGFLNTGRQIVAATGIALPVGENGDTYWSRVRWSSADGPVESLATGTAGLEPGEHLLGYFEETGELIAIRALPDSGGNTGTPRFAVLSVLSRSSCQAAVRCIVSVLESQTVFCRLSGPCSFLCVRIADTVGRLNPENVVAQAGCSVAVSLVRSLLSGGLVPIMTAAATSLAGCFGCADNIFNRNPNLQLACSAFDRITDALDKGLCK